MELKQAIKVIWFESNVRSIIDELCIVSYVMDSAEYFLNEIDRLCEPEYVPSNQDIIRSRAKTTGVYDISFKLGNYDIV